MKTRSPFILLAAVSGLILLSVVWQIKPPENLQTASISQLLVFFLPFYLFLFSLLNIFINHPVKSAVICLALTACLILKGLSLLTIVSFTLIILSTALSLLFIKKPAEKKGFVRIPKLSQLSKQK